MACAAVVGSADVRPPDRDAAAAVVVTLGLGGAKDGRNGRVDGRAS